MFNDRFPTVEERVCELESKLKVLEEKRASDMKWLAGELKAVVTELHNVHKTLNYLMPGFRDAMDFLEE